VGTVIEIRDTAEERRAQAAQARLATLLSQTHEPVFAWELDRGIVFWNQGAEELYGFSAEQALGLQPHALLQTIHPIAWHGVRAALLSEGQWTGELTHTTQSGQQVVVESRQQLVMEGGQRLVLEANRDITGRKRAEAEREQLLERAEAARAEAEAAVRARDEFLSIAAHELLTPVTSLKGHAQLLQRSQGRGDLSPERLASGLQRVTTSADRLTILTRDLLDVARLRTGRIPLRLQPVDLTALATRLAEEHQTRLGARWALRVVGDGTLPTIEADPDRLAQVLDNLLGNAAKYAPEGGAIEVAVRPDGEGVRLEVRDEGIGLPPGAEETIFQPFGRAANVERHAIEGMGLGLYISRQIAERHGGRLWAASPGEGQGSTFSLWLPRVQAHGATSHPMIDA
jgi:PAS domain S-box-containing protein